VRKREHVIYLVAGEGPLRREIEKSIHKVSMEKYAILLGKVDDETLKLAYNSSDVLVMPNIKVEGDMEGFGIVALEAASCGVPVVASALEGIKDAIKNGENGFLVESYNVQVFVNVIEKLLEDDEEREEFGKRAKKLTLENYGWEKIVKDIRTCFQQPTQ